MNLSVEESAYRLVMMANSRVFYYNQMAWPLLYKALHITEQLLLAKTFNYFLHFKFIAYISS